MTVVGILGKQSCETARCLREILNGAGAAGDFSVCDLERDTSPMAPDILVATGGAKTRYNILELKPNSFLIMNPDQKEILADAANSHGILITYGFNNKVCVTASSVMENEIQICIQRDLPTLSGKSVEQQEFGVSADMQQYGPENLLAAITAALVADVEVMVLN